jgi:hypothetical protein
VKVPEGAEPERVVLERGYFPGGTGRGADRGSVGDSERRVGDRLGFGWRRGDQPTRQMTVADDAGAVEIAANGAFVDMQLLGDLGRRAQHGIARCYVVDEFLRGC